mgnify:CR=1 FL=1
MTEKILNNNQVVVAGEIVSDFRFSHEIFGEGFYMVDLVVSRLSDAHDVIPLMVSDRLFDVEKSHIGEKVLAKGQFRIYKYKSQGYNGLVGSKKGRSTKELKMKKSTNPLPLTESEREELMRLRSENEYIKAENEIIKKRIALRQEKWAAQLKAKKQQSSRTSEKKDTN